MNSLPPVDAPNRHDLYEGIDYPRYWDGIGKEKLDELERTLVSSLLPARGQRLIDLGCGYGRLFDVYANRFAEIVLFDGSESLLRMAQSNTNGKAIYVLGDINQLPFLPSAFDAALMVRVFHHMNEPEECLDEIQRILCGGGQFVMNYSNKRNVLRIIQYLLKRLPYNPFAHETLTVEANFYHHHPAVVSGLLSSAAFEKQVLRGAGVLDKLAAACGPLGRFIPQGMFLAPVLGALTLAPWIFCRMRARKSSLLSSASRVIDLLACPRCISVIAQTSAGFVCQQCGTKYPIHDGIIDLRYQQ